MFGVYFYSLDSVEIVSVYTYLISVVPCKVVSFGINVMGQNLEAPLVGPQAKVLIAYYWVVLGLGEIKRYW